MKSRLFVSSLCIMGTVIYLLATAGSALAQHDPDTRPLLPRDDRFQRTIPPPFPHVSRDDGIVFPRRDPFDTNFQTSYIVSDSSWNYSDVFVMDWLNADFDDSRWNSASAPSNGLCDLSSISPDDRIDENGSLPMWTQDPQQHQTVYFRKTFDLSSHSFGKLRVVFDDNGEVYINGYLVLSNHDANDAGIFTKNVSGFLHEGTNVIGIKGEDTFGVCQRVQFELELHTI